MSKALGLYIHIPFCARKCAYCDFYSCADRALQSSYVQALCKLLSQTAAQCRDTLVDSVYFGGGTPSLLSAEELSAILEAVRAFALTPDAEITMEANPASATRDTLKAYRNAGVTRLSIGMQSASDEELALLGRLHRFSDTVRCVSDARAAGFEKLSLDLMYALPAQTKECFLQSLTQALSLAPEHLSLYALTLDEGVPLYRKSGEQPSAEAQREVYLEASKLLSGKGFSHYEISNFALPGAECRHNLKYWRREPYLGFGPAASSFYKNRRFTFPPDLAAFLQEETPFLARLRTEKPLTEREALWEELMLSLRLSQGLRLCEFVQRLDEGARGNVMKECELLCAHALAKRDGEWVSLTEDGFFVSNEILTRLLMAAGL